MEVSTEQPRPASPPIRWWPALLLLAATAAALIWIWVAGDAIRQQRVLGTLGIAALSSLALLLWFFLFSRAPRRIRLRFLAGLGVAVLLFVALFRGGGVSGDFVPILEWRWAAAPDRVPEAEAAAPPLQADGPGYPGFLGENRDAVVAVRLATDWSARPPRRLWRREVGLGWSAFAVRGELAVTQEQYGEQEAVVAYDARSGRVLWSHSYPARYQNPISGTGPRATPTIAGDRIFAMGATGVLTSLDLKGQEQWSRHVVEEHGSENPTWGNSCSPLVVDDLVVVSAGASPDRSLVAYHRQSGRLVWHAGSDASGYSSPQLREMGGLRQIIILNHSTVAGHDPEDGRVLWEADWPRGQPNVAQPLPLPGDRLLVSAGYGVGSKLFGIRRSGEAFEAVKLWETPRLKSKFANLIYFEGYVYGLDDGILMCLDPSAGSRVWKRGRYGHGQLLLAGRHLLLQTEQGEVVLIEPSPEGLRELARFEAFDHLTWNPPALAGNLLLARTHKEAAGWELPVE